MDITWLRQDRLAVIITPRFRTSLTKGIVIPSTMMGGNVLRSMRLTNVLLPRTSTLDLPMFNEGITGDNINIMSILAIPELISEDWQLR